MLTGLAMVVALTAPSRRSFAQVETANGVEVEKDLALVRRNLRAEKKKILAENVPLTETEATKFWHRGGRHCTAIAMAERLCGAHRRLDPPRMSQSRHRLR